MSEYKVSIIVPCYNISSFESNMNNLFKKSFNSVLNQTIGYENIEHIFIDDCSSDNTLDILNNISKRYSNVKVISLPENSGNPSIPRNIGIKRALAEYVMFLDQDDILKDNAVEILFEGITENDVDIVNSNYYIYDGEIILKHDSVFKGNLLLDNNNYKLIDFINFIWTGIYSKKFLIKNNIEFPNKLGEDTYFLTKCIVNTNKKILVLNDNFTYVHIVDNKKSLSQNHSFNQIMDYCTVYDNCFEMLINSNKDDELLNLLFNNLIKNLVGSYILSKNERKKSFSMIQKILVKYDYVELTIDWYWKIACYLIKYNQYVIVTIMSMFIKSFFENKWFKTKFRNTNYK